MENTRRIPILLIATYVLGDLIGFALAVITTWADVEANFYGFPRRANNALFGLNCPIIMSANETGVISIRVSNTTEKPLAPAVKTEISTPAIADSFRESIRLAPGESKKLEWTVGPGNIDLKYFIFAKVLVYASYPTPDREATCGTFIIDLPISGNAFLVIMVALSMTGMGSVLYSLYRSKTQFPQAANALPLMMFQAVVIIIALVVSFIGWWIQAIVALVVALLTIVILPNFLIARQR